MQGLYCWEKLDARHSRVKGLNKCFWIFADQEVSSLRPNLAIIG